MSEFVNIHARKLRDLVVPNDLGTDLTIFKKCKVPVGFLPDGFKNCEALELGQITAIFLHEADEVLQAAQDKFDAEAKVLSDKVATVDGKVSLLDRNISAEKTRAMAAEQGLDNKINAISLSGNKGYVTYAAMDADKANIANNSKVTVFNDPDPSNNGEWLYSGGTFTKSSSDIVTLASQMINEKVMDPFYTRQSTRFIAPYYEKKPEEALLYFKPYASPNSDICFMIYPDRFGVTEITLTQFYEDMLSQLSVEDYKVTSPSGVTDCIIIRNDTALYFNVKTKKFIIGSAIGLGDMHDCILLIHNIYKEIGLGAEQATIYDNLNRNSQRNYFNYAFQRGVNIFDKERVELGMYYDYTGGWKGKTGSGFAAAGPFEIDANTKYRISTTHNQQYALFDANMNYISGQATTRPNFEINTPANAKYLGITVEVTELDTLMITKFDEFPKNYIPFVLRSKKLQADASQVVGIDTVVKDTLGAYVVNILDKSKLLQGYYINYGDGQLYESENFSVAGPYEIKPNTEYQFSNNYGQQFVYLDKYGKYISGVANVSPSFKTVTPSNAKYIRLTVDKGLENSLVVAESSLFPKEYEPYGLRFKDFFVEAKQLPELYSFIANALALEPINIIDQKLVMNDAYVNYLNGEIGGVVGYYAAGPYEVSPSTEYSVTPAYDQQFAFFDENMAYISGQANTGIGKSFKTPANAKYVKFTVKKADLATLVVAKKAVYPFEYLSNDIRIANNLRLYSSQVLDLPEVLDDFIGAETVNIVDTSKIVDNAYVMYENGDLGFNPDYYAAGPYEVSPSTVYKTSSNFYQQFAFFDENMTYISGQSLPASDFTFSTPSNAKYIKLTILKTILNTVVVAKRENFPSSYVPNKVKLAHNLMIKGSSVNRTEVWVSPDLNETDTKFKFKGPNAVQLALNSITDATENNRYVIKAKKGIYKVDKAVDFIGYLGYPAMIEMKDHVDIEGQGENNTIFWAELPYDDAAIGPSADGNTYPRLQYQTIYHYAKDAHVKDLTFIAQNLRYTLHQDNPRGANATHNYHNVGFVYKGDKGAINPLGIGTWEGEETYLYGGRAHSDVGHPFACHNNIQFNVPSGWFFEDFNFSSITNKYGILMQSDGSLLQDKLKLSGCSFGGVAYMLAYVDIWLTGNTTLNRDSFNHAEWHVYGHGNEPFLFENLVSTGLCLRFKSNTVGEGKTIRFDTTSSAFATLIKNNQSNADAAIYVDSREYIDGYITQDGSLGLPAIAFGCKDLTDGAYLYDGGVKYTSLSVRLGDCRTENKQLKLTVDGVVNTINFNQDFTGMSNQSILNIINSQLTNAVADLYVYGRDYYPTITDVSESVYNWKTESGAVQEYIPKGSIVTKRGGYVRKANGNDKVYGVALDDIPVMSLNSVGVRKGQGRVMKRGYIFADLNKPHFVLADNQQPAVGTRFSVNNGQLVTDANGKISVDIDAGVVSINC